MMSPVCVTFRSRGVIGTNGCRRGTKPEATETQKEAVRAPRGETQRLFSGLQQRHELRLATVTLYTVHACNTLSVYTCWRLLARCRCTPLGAGPGRFWVSRWALLEALREEERKQEQPRWDFKGAAIKDTMKPFAPLAPQLCSELAISVARQVPSVWGEKAGSRPHDTPDWQ